MSETPELDDEGSAEDEPDLQDLDLPDDDEEEAEPPPDASSAAEDPERDEKVER